jgi:hypothetical protein
MPAPDQPASDTGPADSGELTVSSRTIIGIVAFILAVGVAFYVLLTSPIISPPADKPAESPAATTGEIPTAVLFVHGRSARVRGLS